MEVQGRADDRVGVDAEVAVEVVDVARLAEVAARRGDAIGVPWTAARNESVCGWPSSTLTIGARPLGRESAVEDAVGPSSSPLRACTARNTRSADVRHTTSTWIPPCVELVGRREHLGHHDAHPDQGHLSAPRTTREAGSRRRAPRGGVALVARVRRHRRQRLIDRPGAEPEVGGGAIRPAEPCPGVQQHPLEVLERRRVPRRRSGAAPARPTA